MTEEAAALHVITTHGFISAVAGSSKRAAKSVAEEAEKTGVTKHEP